MVTDSSRAVISMVLLGRFCRRALVAFSLLVATPAFSQVADPDPLLEQFAQPPHASYPRAYWHWMNGNITPEGIRRDLEWMQTVGVRGVQLFNGSLATPQIVAQRLDYQGPEWKAAFQLASRLAHELGIEFGVASSPGWSISGSPWVKPAEAMKKVVWSEQLVPAGKRFAGVLPLPPAVAGPFLDLAGQAHGDPDHGPAAFYVDTYVLAFPALSNEAALPAGRYTSPQTGQLDAALLSDGRVGKALHINTAEGESSSQIDIVFGEAQTVRALSLATPGSRGFGSPPMPTATLEAVDAAGDFQKIVDVPLTRTDQRTVAFPAVTSRFFRVTLQRDDQPFMPPVDDGVIPMSLGKPPGPGFDVSELALHSEPRVHRFEEKAAFGAAPNYAAIATPPVPPGLAIGSGQVIDLGTHMKADGSIDWTPPPADWPGGNWIVMRMGYSLTGQTNGPAAPEATGLEVDKLNCTHVRNYIDHYLALLIEGGETQPVLDVLLNDSYEAGVQNWTEDLVAQFRRLRGYDPLAWLPALSGRVVDSAEATDRFLWDFRRTIAQRFAECHYGQIAASAREHGLQLYGEALEDHRPALGDDMEMRQYTDIPMAAMWAFPATGKPRQTFVADIRGAASVAHVYGKNLVAAESLTAFGHPWAYAPRDLQHVVDLELALGVNRFVLHSVVHQPLEKPPGMTLAPLLGQYFNRHENWAGQAGPWLDYIARGSFLMQQGKPVADIAYFYGEEAPVTGLFGEQDVAGIPPGLNFDFVNSTALLNEFSVQGGWLTSRAGGRYRLLYLGGGSDWMTLPVLRKIAALAQAGAVIVGSRPKGSPGLGDDMARFQQIADRLWGRPGLENRAGAVYSDGSLVDAASSLGLVPDFEARGALPDQELMFAHRELAAGDIYFVSNRRNRAESFEALFRVTGMQPQRWDAVTGKAEPLAFRTSDQRTQVPLELGPMQSVFIVFRGETSETAREISPYRESLVQQLSGPWTVEFEAGLGAPPDITLDSLTSWSDHADPGVRYFSGTASYTRTFTLAAGAPRNLRLLLDLGEVRELAEVKLNGSNLGILWRPPFRSDISGVVRDGENELEVKVTNLWVNRLIGDQQVGATPRAFTPGNTYSAQAPLRPSGLFGPVRIVVLQSE